MTLASRLATWRLVGGHLPADALDQGPVLLQPLAALLELLDGQVVLVLHLGDRVGRPEEVGQLVDLGLRAHARACRRSSPHLTFPGEVSRAVSC